MTQRFRVGYVPRHGRVNTSSFLGFGSGEPSPDAGNEEDIDIRGK